MSMQHNIKAAFEKSGIEYKSKGRNVGKGEINIQCPFCDDPSKHMGISPKGGCRCLICEWGGWIGEVFEILGLNTGLLKTSKGRVIEVKEKKRLEVDNLIQHAIKTYGLSREIPKEALKYIAKRGINPIKFIKQKEALWGGKRGYFKFRIVFPIKNHKGQVVTLSGRDITGKQEIKYKHLPEEKSILTPKEVFYGGESLTERKNILLVEGIFDQNSFSGMSGAISGKTIHENQISEIINLGIESLLVLIDPTEDEEVGQKIANELNCYIPTKQLVIKGLDKDPGEFNKREVEMVKRLRRSLL